MAKKAQLRTLTADERSALAPAFKKIESARRGLERAFTKLGIDPDTVDVNWDACSKGCGCQEYIPGRVEISVPGQSAVIATGSTGPEPVVLWPHGLKRVPPRRPGGCRPAAPAP